MTALVITRGLPGSGKTTYARAWVAEDREHRARVNRDDIRQMLGDSGERRLTCDNAGLVIMADPRIS